ncbi:3-dehydroquinate synthase [Chthonobacter rhizosphaerae]|uniref:3-dehydroquinate synthase n=1 Tax=Chthonobacter rhizosphaerae TaxID=2735553 RepID=UPI0015EF6F4E|nr:3-dehydroquinate synthase [Chthonobacter rhizosphaerae]
MSADDSSRAGAGETGPVRVPVALGDRSYDILIGDGLLAEAGRLVRAVLPKARACIVTDETVAARHLDALKAGFDEAGVDAGAVVIPPGEGSKSFPVFESVVDQVIGGRYERGDAVVALGGGVVGDLSGFVAGVVRRGMRFVQVPTTLLAQVDSSVGGKTGINVRHGKNLVGVFHQPDLVLADTAVLDTLSERHFRAGYAEVAKYGLIDDAGFFAWLEETWRQVFAGGPARTRAIAVSCRSKAAIVARDEKETGDRALLNLGHTFGHALEAATGYSDRLVHGEAIAIGMVLAHDFSVRMNLMGPDDAIRVRRHFEAVGLPTRLDQVPGGIPDADGLLALIAQDKKVSRGALTFILTRGIGQSFIARDVPGEAVKAFLHDELAG